MFYSRGHARALQAQIDDLKARLAEADTERRELLNRLLEKHNISPLVQSESGPVSQPKIEVLSPWGAIPAEAEDAIRESWLKEETQYLMGTTGIDEDRARQAAEQAYIAQHQRIR